MADGYWPFSLLSAISFQLSAMVQQANSGRKKALRFLSARLCVKT
jgi:hypothetical protein